MTAGGIKEPAVLDELESHLREEIDRQMRAGANQERAFAIAEQKIGPANALKTEFRKSGSASLLERLMIGIAALVVTFGIFLMSVTIVFCYDSWGERSVGFAALGLILLAIFGFPQTARVLPAILPQGRRFALQVACLLAGCGIGTFFFQLVLAHLEGRVDGQLPPIGYWGLIPVAIGLGLACGVEKAARRDMTPGGA